jgi:hypothetical protein
MPLNWRFTVDAKDCASLVSQGPITSPVQPGKRLNIALPMKILLCSNGIRRFLRDIALSRDLGAPMTGEIERQLGQLIAKFGYKKLQDALALLVTKCAFQDWLCVANAVDRLARKIQPKANTQR